MPVAVIWSRSTDKVTKQTLTCFYKPRKSDCFWVSKKCAEKVAPREVQIKRGVRTHIYFVVSILWLLFVLPVRTSVTS